MCEPKCGLKPIESLQCNEPSCMTPCYGLGNGVGNLIIWFIVIAVIAFFLIWAFNPSWVQNKDSNGQANGERNAGKVLIASLVIALIIVLIIWALRYCCRY